MSQTTSPPLEDLMSRLRSTLGDAPASLFDGMRPVLDGFFQQFQLVPRREYDAQLASFATLEDKVSHLEARIAELERGH
jgi:BMFP domain-containing protein YqiC